MCNFACVKYGEIIADVLMRAEMRGLASHGIFRFPRLVESIELGLQNPVAKPEIERETESCVLLNGNYGLGPVVAREAMEKAIGKARQTGIAAVSVRNTNHFGIAAYYTELAAKVDMVGIACCNTEPAMAPFGGKSKILGTNPLSVAIPTYGYPIILDMATTNITRGKLKTSESLDRDWVLDKEGKPAKKLEDAFSLMPLGGLNFGYKGYGLALIVDLLCGALSGACCGKAVRGTASLEKCTKGDLFIAINIASFIDPSLFKSKVEGVIRDIKADGCKLPGEIEYEKEKNTKEMEVKEDVYEELVKIGKKYDVKL
jgi:L-2-hydroxycarboxylate dehydrogenase (NAD+)